MTPPIHFSAAFRRSPSCLDAALLNASAAAAKAGSASGVKFTAPLASIAAVALQLRPHPLETVSGRPGCAWPQLHFSTMVSARVIAVASKALIWRGTSARTSCLHVGQGPTSVRVSPETHPLPGRQLGSIRCDASESIFDRQVISTAVVLCLTLTYILAVVRGEACRFGAQRGRTVSSAARCLR